MYSDKTLKQGPATFFVKWEVDTDSPDDDIYGTYTSERGPWRIDRKKGVFYGDDTELSWTFDNQDAAQNWIDNQVYEEDDLDWYYSPDNPMWDDPYCYGNQDEDLTGEQVRLYYSGYEVLASDLDSTYDRNSYRYFIPPVDNYRGIDKAEQVKYCLQDYKRVEDQNRGYWWFMGCIVTMYVKGLEVASHSVWGIESDSDDGYFKEVEQDLIYECKQAARKYISTLKDAAALLESFSTSEDYEEEEVEEGEED